MVYQAGLFDSFYLILCHFIRNSVQLCCVPVLEERFFCGEYMFNVSDQCLCKTSYCPVNITASLAVLFRLVPELYISFLALALFSWMIRTSGS